MAATYILLSKIIVGVGGSSTIAFTNIPQSYTDLQIKASVRSGYNGFADGYLYFDGGGGTTQYSSTITYGDGSWKGSYRYSNNGQSAPYPLAGSNVTANTFTNFELYIPNYTTSNNKQFLGMSGAENNATASRNVITGNLWRSSSAITSLTFSTANGFVEGSSIYLYGIKNS